MIVGVLVELANKNVDKIFDYKVNAELQKSIKVGIRVLVPFGKQIVEGFVLEIKKSSEYNSDLKEIINIKDEEIVLNEELLELGKVMHTDTLAAIKPCYLKL